MAKVARKSRAAIDEEKLIELVMKAPELYDPSFRENDGTDIDLLWEEIAEKLGAPVPSVKNKWKCLQGAYGRRTSLRSTPNFNFVSLPLVELSNENSCASSNCSSPKGDGKRSTRSVSQLSTASEAERTLSTFPTSTAMSFRKSDSRRSRMASPIQEDTTSIIETQSADGNGPRYEKRALSMEDISQPGLPESSFLASKEVLQNAVNSAPRRLMGTPRVQTKIKKNNVSDPTGTFFESMAMTVSTFPPHIQAMIKIQICNIVSETEYAISIPKPC